MDVMPKVVRQRVGFLDQFRGMAILAVFLGHALNVSIGEDFGDLRKSIPEFLFRLVPVLMQCFCDAGVPIFFIVSGFCIHMSFHQQGRDWRSFFIRRFFRIYPPYLLAVLLFAVVFPLTRFDIITGWWQMAYHLLLIHNLNAGASGGINPSFWTIGVEVQLYLLYPLVLALATRLGWPGILCGLAALELGLRTACIIHPGFLNDYWFMGSPFFYWFSWSLGAALADAYLHGRTPPLVKFSPGLWLVLAVVCYHVAPLKIFVFPIYAVLTTIIIGRILTGTAPEFRVPQFCREHLRITGVCSYSIYLLHQPIMAALSVALNSWFINPVLVYLACVFSWLVIMPLGWLWWRFLELPSIAWGKQIIQRIEQRQP